MLGNFNAINFVVFILSFKNLTKLYTCFQGNTAIVVVVVVMFGSHAMFWCMNVRVCVHAYVCSPVSICLTLSAEYT